jgi:hypothetical protein
VSLIVLGQNSHLRVVCDFVIRRLDERISSAERAGDEGARSFAWGSRRLVEQMRADLVERPWTHREVGNYLLRAARRYCEHPEFCSWWG